MLKANYVPNLFVNEVFLALGAAAGFCVGAGGVALSGRERRSARCACRDAGAEDCLLWAEGGGASRGLGGAGARGRAPFGASARGVAAAS